MEEKKKEYLKNHLEQALENNDYYEANSCYQELLKYVKATDIPDMAQRVGEFNNKHAQNSANRDNASIEKLKKRIRTTKRKYKTSQKMRAIGLGGGVAGMILGCVITMVGGESSGPYSDLALWGGMVVAAIGLALVIVDTCYCPVYAKAPVILAECRGKLFQLLCAGEEKLKYLERVGTIDDYYCGQIEDDTENGFGVAICENGFYIGQWEDGEKSGIGKFISDDMLMVLEGEFEEDQVNGMVDIQFEDGSQWHGVHKDDLPWDGKGTTIVDGRIQNGIWKNGILISE